MGETYLSDNKGHRVPPHPHLADPVDSTGQTLTNASKDTNTTVTVEAGATYALTAQEVGGFYVGIGNPVSSATRIIWACPIYQTIIIHVPEGVTTLRYATDTANAIGYLRKLATP